jgi:hypothetical protein
MILKRRHVTGADSPSLFSARKDWWNNACLNHMHDGWFVYAEGYRRGAEVLIAQATAHTGDLDALVYPIVYLYRHYVELSLKILIRDTGRLLGQPSEPPLNHNLRTLWSKAEQLLRQAFPDQPTRDFAAVGGTIEELAGVDPASEAFRYPLTKSGSASMPGLSHINIAQFRDRMLVVERFLEGATSMVDHYVSEMEHELPPYWRC